MGISNHRPTKTLLLLNGELILFLSQRVDCTFKSKKDLSDDILDNNILLLFLLTMLT